jgi:prophage maintenance system killer protein
VIYLDLPAALAIAAEVLGCSSETIVELADVDGVEATLAEARAPHTDQGAVPAAAHLLVGLVRGRPYPRRNRRIALATALQFLALNGWDLDLDDVAGVNQLLDSIAAGPSAEDVTKHRVARVGDQLRARLRPLHTGRPRVGRETKLDVGGLSEFELKAHRRTTKGRRGAMFEKFTDRARRATVLAQEEARLFNHHYIGTEHILLGLLRDGEGVAAKALESLGVTTEAVRAQVEEIVGRGDHSPPGHIPFTPRAKKVLEISLRESIHLGTNYIGTEHILLGLIREGEGVATQALVKLGLSLDVVTARVLQRLGGHDTGASGASGASGAAEAVLEASWEESVADIGDMVRESLIGSEHPGGRRSLILRETMAMLDDNDRLRAETERLAAEVSRLRNVLRHHDINPDA